MFTKKSKTKLLFISLVFLVGLRVFFGRPVYQNGDKVRISAKVSQEPIRYDAIQSLNLAGLKIYLPVFPEIDYGDKVIIEGVVDGKKLKNPELIKVKENNNFLFLLRMQIINFYQKSLPEPHAGLLAGMVLGAKTTLSADFWQALRKTGTAHVVVASGMNVSLVAGFLMGLATLVWLRKKAIVLVLVGIGLYCLLIGPEAPIVRAAIMGGLTFVAQKLGRLASAWRILVFSALAMLLYKPEWLGDIGFILSFIATASILLFEKRIRNKLSFLPGGIKEGFSTSLAAQIGVGPILFVTFGQFNILSPVINALVLWTVPLITMIGMAGGIIGLIIPGLGKIILYFAYPLSWWFTAVVQRFS